MKEKFLQALADAKDYPVAKMGMLPGRRTINGNNERRLPERCVAIEYMATARGILSAIAYCFKGKKVLIPCYHCPAIVEPFLYHQCEIEFYGLNEQLEFDPDDLEGKLLEVDLIVGVRYFGFSCNMATLKTLAVKTNTFMVEDLAHAAFVKQIYGDVAVTSLKKFYPINEGAELYIGNPDWVNNLNKSVNKLRPSRLYSFCSKVLEKFGFKSIVSESRYFVPTPCHGVVPFFNHYVLNHYNHLHSAELRRSNYVVLAKAFKALSFAEPLFPVLEPDVVPYVFPLLIKDEKYFSLIRQAGIPLFRWEEIVETSCAASLKFRRLLVQLPCHQDLKSSDLDYIIKALFEIELQGRGRK